MHDPLFAIINAFKRIFQEAEFGLGKRAQRQPFSDLGEPTGELFEVAASMYFPNFDHLLNLREIVGSGWSTGDSPDDGLTHIIPRQWGSLAHVVRRLFGVSTDGIDPRHLELRGCSFPFVADLSQVVERLFCVDAAFCDEFFA